MSRYLLMLAGMLGVSATAQTTLTGGVEAPFTALLALAGSLFAVMLYGSVSPLAIASGAIGVCGWVLLCPLSPMLGGAFWLVAMYLPRTLRSRDRSMGVLQLALAAASGILSTYLLIHFGDHPRLVIRVVAFLMAGLIAAIPFAIDVEEPLVHTLLTFSRAMRGGNRQRLLRAAAIARRIHERPFSLSREDERRLHRACIEIVRLAEKRMDAGVTDAAAIDRILGSHIRALSAFWRALRARWMTVEAAEVSPSELDAASERVVAEASALDQLIAE